MQKLYSVVENDCIEERKKMYKHSRHNTRHSQMSWTFSHHSIRFLEIGKAGGQFWLVILKTFQ